MPLQHDVMKPELKPPSTHGPVAPKSSDSPIATNDDKLSLSIVPPPHPSIESGSSPDSCLSGELWQPLYSVASVARPFQDFSFDFGGGHGQEQNATEATLPVTSAEYQQLITHAIADPGYLQPQQSSYATQNNYTHYGASNILPSPVSAPEPIYGMGATPQQQILASQKPRQMSQIPQVASAPPHYGSPYHSPPVNVSQYQQDPAAAAQQHPSSRKRSFQEEYDHYSAYQGLQQLPSREFTPYAQQAQQQQIGFHYPQYPSQRSSPHPSHSSQSMRSTSHQSTAAHQQQQASQHHHHRLPNQQPPNKLARWDLSPTDDEDDHGPPSVVGQPGMPAPAPRPKGPKLKFTPEDDALLVELKETKNLTWKQIADFFPGRSSGTLQVRYCTKLKAKRVVWGDDMVARLRSAMHEYDQDRWRIVASKVGNGFSAVACKEKALELEGFLPPPHQPEGLDDQEEAEDEEDESTTGFPPSHGYDDFPVRTTTTTTTTDEHDDEKQSSAAAAAPPLQPQSSHQQQQHFGALSG
ncbi:hypothetical protein AC578_2901 [Lecanosticta acicola]|uniref:Myb-like domain-containing protein n=1 Tax=Lecanosticta acicola TaxID=111012 RepID=A0AAI9ECP0_9PEZI|nr:hypothetical protein AC578_2901 [Lecanosticta acicola]